MRKKRLNPNVIRVDDYVKIVTPDFFIRCGYPLTKEIVKETLLTKEKKLKILQLLEIKTETLDFIEENKTYQKILDELAYHILKQNEFGGKERKIYTETLQDLTNKEYRVISKSVKKTGFYKPSSYYGYYEPEYEPAFLEKEKGNVILTLNCYSYKFKDWLKIEAKNVIKISTEKDFAFIGDTYEHT